MNEQTRPQKIAAFNNTHNPFYLVDHRNEISLCCVFHPMPDSEFSLGQEAFNRYAESIGEPVKDRYGLYTHGSGYEWEYVFRKAFKNDPNIDKVHFDCEAGGFFAYGEDVDMMADFGHRFLELMRNEEALFAMLPAAISEGEQQEAKLRDLSEKELDSMCTKHTLWRDYMGDEKADFSNCRITDANLSHLDLSECSFDGAVLEKVIMYGTDFRSCSFRGAVLKDCNGQNMIVDHADFTKAKFLGGSFRNASMENCQLVDALFNGCEMGGANLFKSCIQDAVFAVPDYKQLDLDTAIPDLEQWQSEVAQEQHNAEKFVSEDESGEISITM